MFTTLKRYLVVLLVVGAAIVGVGAFKADAATKPPCPGPIAVTTWYPARFDRPDELSCDVHPPQRYDIRIGVRSFADRPLARAARLGDHYGCSRYRIETVWGRPFLRAIRCDY